MERSGEIASGKGSRKRGQFGGEVKGQHARYSGSRLVRPSGGQHQRESSSSAVKGNTETACHRLERLLISIARLECIRSSDESHSQLFPG